MYKDTDLVLGGSPIVTNETLATSTAPQAPVRGMTPLHCIHHCNPTPL